MCGNMYCKTCDVPEPLSFFRKNWCHNVLLLWLSAARIFNLFNASKQLILSLLVNTKVESDGLVLGIYLLLCWEQALIWLCRLCTGQQLQQLLTSCVPWHGAVAGAGKGGEGGNSFKFALHRLEAAPEKASTRQLVSLCNKKEWGKTSVYPPLWPELFIVVIYCTHH